MTNEEMNQMFDKNVNIAYKIARSYCTNYPEEYEDIKQIALLGLWKAIQCYNPKWALSTIAYKIISSNINFYIRSVKKTRDKNISMDTVIYKKENDALTIEDVIEDEHDAIEAMLSDIDIKHAFNKLNLSRIEKKVIELKRQGLSQREISKRLNRSQPQISRILVKLRERFKANMNGKTISYTPYKILKPIELIEEKQEKTEVIHKVLVDKSNDYKDENDEFCNGIDDILERVKLINYFREIQ